MTKTFHPPFAAPFAIVLLLCGSTSVHGASSFYPDVTVLSESRGGLVLRYTLPPAGEAERKGDWSGFPWHEGYSRAGFPAVPVRNLIVALPPGSDIRVELVDRKVEESSRFDVEPFPGVYGPGKSETLRWADDAPGGLLPEGWFEVSRPSRLRDLRVATVTLHPVRFDRGSGKTALLRSGTLRITFTGGIEAPKGATLGGSHRDPFDALYNDVVINRRTASAWRTPPPRRKSARTAGDSFFSSSDWIRISVKERGMYGVSYEDLAAAGVIDPRSAVGDPRGIRLYWGGGQVLPELVDAPRPEWMRQVSIHVTGEDDGSFDPTDRIEFFALGSKGWIGEFRPDTTDYWRWYEHRYADEGVYWLTWGGDFQEEVADRIASVDASTAVEGETPILTVPERIHFEVNFIQDLTRPGSDGWFWDRFSQNENDKAFRNLVIDDADTTAPGLLRANLFHFGDAVSICGNERAVFSVNNIPADSITWNSCIRSSTGGISSVVFESTGQWVKDGSNFVRIQARSGQQTLGDSTTASFRSKFFLDWIEIGYDHYLRLSDDRLHFRLPEAGAFVVNLSGASSGVSYRIFDVTDPFAPSELSGFAVEGDTLVAHLSLSGAATFEALSESKWKTPATLVKRDMLNLRAPGSGAQYVIIDWDEYASAAAPLAAHRAKEYTVKTVLLSDVYDQFSWGQKDVSAVRDFLLWAYHEWPAGEEGENRLAYALLVGDATNDWKGRSETALHDLIPSYFYIDPAGFDEFMYPTDDYFTYLDPATGDPDWVPDIAIGRIPANSAEEVSVVVNKIIDYDNDPEFGEWRNRLLWLGDDERKGLDYDCAFRLAHVRDVERTAVLIPESFEMEKVYLTEYPLNDGGEKPRARDAYLDWVTDGFLVSSYTGHGGFAKMADENILDGSVAVPERLRNGKRLGLFTAWSCSIGSFDLLEVNSLSEIFVKMEGAGAIGSFASGAPAFPNPSMRLNRAFFLELFPTGHSTVSVGLAAMVAKATAGARHSGEKLNDEKYNIMGDPALRLAVPPMEVRFDNIDDLEFQRGTFVTVGGSVMENDSTVAAWFDGDCHLDVRGMADTSGYRFQDKFCQGTEEKPQEIRQKYTLNGPTFFRGVVDVKGGRFETTFFVPLDTRLGTLGRVGAYVVSPSDRVDGAGGDDSVTVTAEPAGTTPSDNEPPALSLEVDGVPLRNGTSFTRESVFRVVLEDESGVNLQQNDDFYTINIVFDGGRPEDLTSMFTYDRNSHTKGGFTFRLDDLPDVAIQNGGHELAFRAADNLNQRVEVVYPVVLVAEGSTLAFREDVLNYPNPFNPDREDTGFFVDLTRGGFVTVEIFTSTGKRVREFRGCHASGPVMLEDCRWDGRDADGDIVANGTYLVRASAVSDDGSEEAESIGRVVVLRGVE